MPIERDEDLPSTLRRSPKKVQRAYAKTLENAEEQYDSGERARRTAWASVKHVAEKKGDHWELKDEPGPSDEQAERGGAPARRGSQQTRGGINANKPKRELYEDAQEAGIAGRSRMSKDELVDALEKHAGRATDRARRRERRS